VKLAHPLETKAIAKAKLKTDRRDIDLSVPLFTRRGRGLLKCLGIDAVNQLLYTSATTIYLGHKKRCMTLISNIG